MLPFDGAWGGSRLRPILVVAVAMATLLAHRASAWVDLGEYHNSPRDDPHGIHILDGSYVMNVGELQINITNHGLIGSQFTSLSTYSDAPSAQWPAGSGNEYLWAAGLWVGGVVGGERRVSTGQYEREFRPRRDVAATIYEARDGVVVRPPGYEDSGGHRFPHPEPDDDGDGRWDEETLNGYDDDGDGLIEEDFGQIGTQMMVCTMYDNTRLSQEDYPAHEPLELEVIQKSYAWAGELVRNFVGFEFQITNIGTYEIENVYVGFFADCDIGTRGSGNIGQNDMAGFYDGMTRATDGTFTNVTVGYMYDGAREDPLPGYFGILFLGPRYSPVIRIRSFQSFTGIRPFELGGDPEDDEGRYELLSAMHIDPNTRSGEEGDYRFLVSVGPWPLLAPGQTIRLHAAMVIGEGLEGMLQTCADAQSTWNGSYFDLDGDSSTGVRGRETRMCYPQLPTSGDPIYQSSADFMDLSCIGSFFDLQLITPNDFELEADGTFCIWVNMDNCQECDRLAGEQCTSNNNLIASYWNCNRWWWPEQERFGCTGIGGAESQVIWIATRFAPPSPGMRIWPIDRAVHMFWDDRSEHAVDLEMGLIDFESYRIWRADNWDRPLGSSLANGPEIDLWQLIDEFDSESYYITEVGNGNDARFDTLALGRNTGLEGIAYRPVSLDAPHFQGLAAEMQLVVDGDSLGLFKTLPPLRDGAGRPVSGLEGLLPWESYPAVLDTFFQVTARESDPIHEIVGKRPVKFYEYVDHDIKNGFLYFYSVTATDHRIIFRQGQPRVVGSGLSGSPSSNFIHAVPGTRAQSPDEREHYGPNIYVYPNPVTIEALSEFQQLHPNSQDPSGKHVMFANLPQAHNKISIFTLDGDLVQELWHDGISGHGEMSWNLISRNGQEILSGIYLYVVESDNDRFDDVIGKFVMIR